MMWCTAWLHQQWSNLHTGTCTGLAALPWSWGFFAAVCPETSCFHLALQGRRLCAGQPRRCHLTSSWTLPTATGYGLGILAQGQAYNESLMTLHLLNGLNEVTKDTEATFTASKVKGGVFRCPENHIQLSAKASLVFNGLRKVHMLPWWEHACKE